MMNERSLKLLADAGLSKKEMAFAEDAGLDLYRTVDGAVLSRVTCGRCGGSGSYSYCEAHGTDCFECNAGRRDKTHVGFVFELPKKTVARMKRTAARVAKMERHEKAVAEEAAMLAKCGFVSYLDVWNSLRAAHERAVEAKRLAKVAAMKHVGEIGGRIELEVTVLGYHRFDGYYGVRELVRMADADGNVLVWWTGSCPGFLADRGAKARIKATVKSHDVYEKTGEPQTVLLRVSVLEEISEGASAADCDAAPLAA